MSASEKQQTGFFGQRPVFFAAVMESACVVSAPGKVFVAGGYVVLNGYDALVLTTSARFYSKVTHGSAPNTVIVDSLQFGKRYEYDIQSSLPLIKCAKRFFPRRCRVFTKPPSD
jgi:phosphomevalonate kinase